MSPLEVISMSSPLQKIQKRSLDPSKILDKSTRIPSPGELKIIDIGKLQTPIPQLTKNISDEPRRMSVPYKPNISTPKNTWNKNR